MRRRLARWFRECGRGRLRRSRDRQRRSDERGEDRRRVGGQGGERLDRQRRRRAHRPVRLRRSSPRPMTFSLSLLPGPGPVLRLRLPPVRARASSTWQARLSAPALLPLQARHRPSRPLRLFFFGLGLFAFGGAAGFASSLGAAGFGFVAFSAAPEASNSMIGRRLRPCRLRRRGSS